MLCKYKSRLGVQCTNIALDHNDYCEKHTSQKGALKSYLLSHVALNESSARHAASEVASLRDEIAITRALVEERLNLITNPSELLAACGQVNALLLTVERLVQTSVKTEEKLGELLSKTAVVELASSIVAILSDELKDVEGYETIVDNISERISQKISNM